MKKFLTIMSLLTVIVTPAFSAAMHHRTAQSSGQLYMYGPVVPSAARDAAIHECSVKAGKWSMITWQTTQFAVYGTCMAEHGQQP